MHVFGLFVLTRQARCGAALSSLPHGSQAFVDCCNELKANGQLAYERLDEGVNYSQHEAHVPADIDRSKCTFHQGDACSLDPSLGTFDVVLMANLLCRLPNPQGT